MPYDPPRRSPSGLEGQFLFRGYTEMRVASRGQGLAEYALILALIAILAITALMFLSGQIDTILSTIAMGL